MSVKLGSNEAKIKKVINKHSWMAEVENTLAGAEFDPIPRREVL